MLSGAEVFPKHVAGLIERGLSLGAEKVNPAEIPLVSDDLRVYAKRPLDYVLDRFPWGKGSLQKHVGPDQWQVDLLQSVQTKLLAGSIEPDEVVSVVIMEACASGHGIGKSALIAMVICWGMDTRGDTRGVVTANTEVQLVTKTWPEITKWANLGGLSERFLVGATTIKSRIDGHGDTWRLDRVTWSERNTEAFAGLHNQGSRVLIVFDEGSAIVDPIWETTEGALTDRDTEIIWLVFGNPTRTAGRFRECWRKFRNLWTTRQVDSRSSRFTNHDLLAELVAIHGEDSDYVKVRVRGVFPSASVKQFIGTDLVDAARSRTLLEHQVDGAARILTLDPAWSGKDEYVIAIRQGLYARVLWTGRKVQNDIWLAQKLAALEDEFEADAVFIDFGYGTGVKSAGDTWGRTHWELVAFGGASEDPAYLNKRGEIWGKMKKWLEAGGAIDPKDDVLYEDLIGPEYTVKEDGKIVLESKEAMKSRGIPSPNRGDAIALSFASPVLPRDQRANTGGMMETDTSYRP